VREKVFVLGRGNNEKTEESEEEKNALLKTHEIKDADGKRKREWKNNGYMYSIMKYGKLGEGSTDWSQQVLRSPSIEISDPLLKCVIQVAELDPSV
jgi:hypothetical protein